MRGSQLCAACRPGGSTRRRLIGASERFRPAQFLGDHAHRHFAHAEAAEVFHARNTSSAISSITAMGISVVAVPVTARRHLVVGKRRNWSRIMSSVPPPRARRRNLPGRRRRRSIRRDAPGGGGVAVALPAALAVRCRPPPRPGPDRWADHFALAHRQAAGQLLRYSAKPSCNSKASSSLKPPVACKPSAQPSNCFRAAS